MSGRGWLVEGIRDHQRIRPGEVCELVLEDGYPYDCEAARRHPDHLVVVCRRHWVWWHGPAPVEVAS